MSDSTVHMTPETRMADGLQIRFAETAGSADQTVLPPNPWPRSLLARNTIWPRLAERPRSVAIEPSNAEFLHARLPDSRLDILDTNHFTREDGADDYLELTTSWVAAQSSADSTG
jgi:hypothetical protein